ncbi:hypothetical protein ACTXT7_006518 [Hymenolepis weldensis]
MGCESDLENLDEYIFSLPNFSVDMPDEGEEDEKTSTQTPTKSESKTVRSFRDAFKEKKIRVFEFIESTASTYERFEGHQDASFVKFTKTILRPNAPRNNELADFLSRIPDLIEAAELTEYRPDAFVIPQKGRLFSLNFPPNDTIRGQLPGIIGERT